VSTLEHTLEPEVTTVHRLEVITGAGRRRRFTEAFKARGLANEGAQISPHHPNRCVDRQTSIRFGFIPVRYLLV
jgi:hypothetical protein